MSMSSLPRKNETHMTGSKSSLSGVSDPEVDLYPTIRSLWLRGEITLFEAWKMEQYYLLITETPEYPGERVLTEFMIRVLKIPAELLYSPKQIKQMKRTGVWDLSQDLPLRIVLWKVLQQMQEDGAIHPKETEWIVRKFWKNNLVVRWERLVNGIDRYTVDGQTLLIHPAKMLEIIYQRQFEAMELVDHFLGSLRSTRGTTSESMQTSPEPSSSSTNSASSGQAIGRESSFVYLREIPGFY
jgi:hypothetical protein